MNPSAPYGLPDEAVSSKKPSTLTTAGWLAMAVGVLSILGSITMIIMGKDSILAAVKDQLEAELGPGIDPELLAAAANTPEFDSAYSALITKAVIGLIVGVVVLVLALMARNGATGARIGLAIALVVGMCAGAGLQLADMDALPSVSVGIASITPLLSLFTIVLLFLPATNKYAASRKAVARA
jgi:hypothetical protein